MCYENYSICILAGGQSSRMGSKDKGLAPFLGHSLIEHILTHLQYGFIDDDEKFTIISNRPQNYAFLQSTYPVTIKPDIIPGMGALGGLFSALTYADTPLVVVLACDMPFIDTSIITKGIKFISTHPHSIFIPFGNDKLQPFHSVYRAELCIPFIKQALTINQKEVIHWIIQADPFIHYVNIRKTQKFTPFFNINTDEDLITAEKIWIKQQSKKKTGG